MENELLTIFDLNTELLLGSIHKVITKYSTKEFFMLMGLFLMAINASHNDKDALPHTLRKSGSIAINSLKSTMPHHVQNDNSSRSFSTASSDSQTEEAPSDFGEYEEQE